MRKGNFMGKKMYVTPMAVEEAFVVNCYVAKCNNKVSSSEGDQYRCINPDHDHSTWNGEGLIIGYVFVEATTTACTMKVTTSTVKTQLMSGGSNSQPAYGAIVYGPNGEAYECTEEKTYLSGRDTKSYYIPTTDKCYGSFVNEGTYSEWTENLFS